MKRIIKSGGLLVALAAPALQAQVINFHNAYNYANYNTDNSFPLYGSVVYSGQGAYSDPGNNVWNGFGGGFPPQPSAGFSPASKGHTTPAGQYSDGTLSAITLTVIYGFDNGGLYNTHNTYQGTPAFILGEQAGVDSSHLGFGTTSPKGEFILHNVLAGTYNLYFYGASFDAKSGALFSLSASNGGTAHNGVDGTINDGDNSTFVEGVNYAIFENVTPDANGNITGFWTPNPGSTVAGEGDFNGLQLVTISVSEPSTVALTISQSGGTFKVSWPYPSTGWTLQQNSDLTTGNWTPSGGVANDGTNNFITITSPKGNLFFRLNGP